MVYLSDAGLPRLCLNKCLAVAEMDDRLATVDMGRKLGVCAPFLGGAGSPFCTMRPGPRPTSMPSGILIHLAVWLCPLFEEGELGPYLTQCGQGQGLPACQVLP